MSNDNKDVPQRGITINGVGEIPQWVKGESERLYPLLTTDRRDYQYRQIGRRQAYVKARMMGIAESIEFAKWIREQHLITNGVIWKYKSNQYTDGELFKIYQQQKQHI